MKRLIHLAAALAMAAAVSACGHDGANDRATGAAKGTGGTVGTSGSMAADRDFVHEQLAMGTAEIELGRLAQQRGTRADVKEFGAMMVRDHQTAAAELEPIASKVNSTSERAARTNPGDDYKDEMDELSKLSGRDFDRKYIDEMIEDHEEGVKDLENKAGNAASPDVKQWAAKTLPKMRQHLERARAIKETLDRASNNN
jgi:putative membrane protein